METRRIALAAAFVVCAAVTSQTSAGVLSLFGDVNMFGANATTGSINYDDPVVLQNVLGSGSTVLISEQISGIYANNTLETFFNGLGGVSASTSGGDVDDTLLSGVDLLILDLGFNHDNPYSGSEISAISSFLASGGDIMMIAEPYLAAASINSLLSGLGSTMTFGDDRSGQDLVDTILPTFLTAGVSEFDIMAAQAISGGTAAIQNEGFTKVAFEIFGDQAIPEPKSVPEPITLLLLGLGLAGLCFSRRRLH